MHAALSKPRMSEEAFQILLDLMEQHFAALTLPQDERKDHKLYRTVSFSEIPSARRILVEQCFQSKSSSSSIVKGYSSELIFDKSSMTRQVKFSEFIRSGSSERKNFWEATIPSHPPIQWFSQTGPNPNDNPQKVVQSKATENGCESMEVDQEVGYSPKQKRSFIAFPTSKNTSDELEMTEKIKCELASKQICSENWASNDQASCSHDPSSESKKKREIKFRPTFKPRSRDSKLRLRSLVAKTDDAKLRQERREKTKEEKHSKMLWRITFFVLLLLVAVLICLHLNEEESSDEFYMRHLTNTSLELQRRVYGQSDAVKELIDYFEGNREKFKLLALVGGTGVGKSFVAGIVKKNFPHVTNTFEYFPPLGGHLEGARERLSLYYCNLVVLESLKPKDLPLVTRFAKIVKTREEPYCVTMLALINPHTTDENLQRYVDLPKGVREVESAFREENLVAKVVGFEALNEEALDICIKQTAEELNVTLSKDKADAIKRMLQSGNVGCKGAYSKILLTKENQFADIEL